MGIFRAIHDTAVAADLIKAANSINEYQRSIIRVTSKYSSSTRLDSSDKILLRGYLNSIEDKACYMQRKMQDIAPYNLFKTMVPCIDGHMTAVPGYVMAMLEMVREFKTELNNY
jgi:hypothetical protein